MKRSGVHNVTLLLIVECFLISCTGFMHNLFRATTDRRSSCEFHSSYQYRQYQFHSRVKVLSSFRHQSNLHNSEKDIKQEKITEERQSWSFGIIGDIQYVDAENAMNFQKTQIRRYRQSLCILREAVHVWNLVAPDMKCAVLLGDQLDGKCNDHERFGPKFKDSCLQDLQEVTSSFSACMHYCFGNHDYYSFNRNELLQHFIPQVHKKECSDEKLYYDWISLPPSLHLAFFRKN